MDTRDDNKVAERATPTKFERREWFLENLHLLLSVNLNEDPSDEESRSESLRLHRMEATVSVCTPVSIGLTLTTPPSLFCVDKQFPRTALSLGSIPRGNGAPYYRDHQKSCQGSRRSQSGGRQCVTPFH